jgi:hypothetical protein
MAVDDYVHREAAAQVAELCLIAGEGARIPHYMRHLPFVELVREDLGRLAEEQQTKPAAASQPKPDDLQQASAARLAAMRRPAD